MLTAVMDKQRNEFDKCLERNVPGTFRFLFMHTGIPRKMPAKPAGARRASRGEKPFPYLITQPRAEEDAAKAAHGARGE